MRNETITRYMNFGSGLQTSTSRLFMADDELSRAVNARYNKKIGGVSRRLGYEKVGETLSHGNPVNGLNSYFRGDGNHNLLATANGETSYENHAKWTEIVSGFASGARVDFENFLDYVFMVGYDDSSDTFIDTKTINSSLVSSADDNVYDAPKGKYVAKYKNKVHIANVEVNGDRYPDRVYISSIPMSTITFVRTDQKKSTTLRLYLDSVRHIKKGMFIDIYGERDGKLKAKGLPVTHVDKATNSVGFPQRGIDVNDQDHVYLSGKKEEMKVFWNTDYPTKEEASYLTIPPVNNENPVITGLREYNNRLFIFTTSSVWKWDGANLVLVTDKTGTTSHWSIEEINRWLVFIGQNGIWAWNDNEGNLQQLSRGIRNYTDAINPTNLPYAVGWVDGDLYRVFVGELDEIDSRPTSTSTSSTSTSTTTTSTSSTSTSSTSTSYSSTSTSTSTSLSTSTSTSMTTTSTSSTSSTTTTEIPDKRSTIFTFDSSLVAWSQDITNRDITYAVSHKMHGYRKIYFGDETGRVYRDNTGLTDDGHPIDFLIDTKRYHLDRPEETKYFRGVYIFSQYGQYATASISIDGGQWEVVGQLDKHVTYVPLGDKQGRDIAFRITQNNSGESVVFIGVGIQWLQGELRHESV